MKLQPHSRWRMNWDWRTDWRFQLFELQWWNDETKFISITLCNFTLAVILRERP